MFRQFYKFYDKFFKKESHSLLRALYRVIPNQILESEIKLLDDWRCIVAQLSKKLNISEEALWFRVADELGLQFIERVPPCNASALPEGITIEDLIRVGAIPLQKGGKIVGIICLDPKRVASLGLIGQRVDYYLAPWEMIKHALLESETIARQLQVSDVRQPSKNISSEDTLALEIFNKVIEEVVEAEESEVEFEFEADKITYSYTGKKGASLQGTIAVRISNPLLRLFRTLPHNLALSEIMPFGLKPVFQFIAGPLTKVRVSWRAKSNSDSPLLETPLVVIVDDNPVFTKVIEKFFSAHSFRIQSFSKAREGISWIAAHSASIGAVICDLHMPEVDGFRFLKELKGDPRLAQLPIVALTSDNSSEAEIEALKLGVDAFVNKNEDPLLVLLHIQRLTQRLRAA